MVHASASPMIVPPHSDSANPTTATRLNRSFNNMGDSTATHNGPVDTKTAELATVVYSSEVIHAAKWIARKMPDTTPNTISLRVKRLISARYCVNAMGAINKVAIVNRSAAITNEGASVCARRIKIEAVEMARMATNIPMGSRKRVRCSVMRASIIEKYPFIARGLKNFFECSNERTGGTKLAQTQDGDTVKDPQENSECFRLVREFIVGIAQYNHCHETC